MTDIAFIKWMCEKADSYLVMNGRIYYEGGYFKDDVSDLIGDKLHKKNLLQEAIEGVNKSDGKYLIVQWPELIDIVNNDKDSDPVFEAGLKDNTDQAKEAALKYIYEQEKGKQ